VSQFARRGDGRRDDLHNLELQSTSKHAVATAASSAVDADIVQYLKARREATLRAIIANLETPGHRPRPPRRQLERLGLTDADVATTDQVVACPGHKELMQRPLVVTADRAITAPEGPGARPLG